MFSVSRDGSSTDLIIRLAYDRFDPIHPNGMAEEMIKEIKSFLVKEFIKQHGKNILGVISPNNIAHDLEPAIAEHIAKLFITKENHE